MWDWLLAGAWQDEPIIERKSRKRPRGPSWGVFYLGLGVMFGAGACFACSLLAAITPHG